MQFQINPERDAYLQARGKVVLNACPGSGKTTVIAYKLIGLQQECTRLFGDYSGIACLSFTNTAKDEINEKYQQLSQSILRYPNIVSTIDSFINLYITLPFYYLYSDVITRPKILDNAYILDDYWLTEIIDYKTNRPKTFVKKPLSNYRDKYNRPIFHTYMPHTIRYELDGTYSTDGKRPSADKVDNKIFQEYGKYLKEWQVKNGLLTTSDSSFIGLQILHKVTQIGELLIRRFPYIIIDEAQDNSELQHAIFDKLIELGLQNIELIGDPYQSLYEWRDAKPKLFIDKFNNTDWNGLRLSKNRRSNKRIINCFCKVKQKDEPIIEADSKDDLNLPITVYKFGNNNVNSIIEDFETKCVNKSFQKNLIVARSLKHKSLGFSQDQKPWKLYKIPNALILVMNDFEKGDIKSAVNSFRKIYIELVFHEYDYQLRKELENYLREDFELNAELLKIIAGLPDFHWPIKIWTTLTQNYLQKSFDLDIMPDFRLKQRSSTTFKKEILNDNMLMHFKKAYTEKKIPYTTIHQVKGRTLDSILVFFNSRKHKENITFEDIYNPDSFPEETQRMIYVAMSRPKHLLALAFPNIISNEELIKKFGDNIDIIEL